MTLDVAVLGAGQAGLAAAALLRRAGLDAVVLERRSVGATWRGHYDRLTLNTDRRLSSLPGLPLPASAGQWPTRNAFVAYLERYAEVLGVPVRTGVDVVRVHPADGGWRLALAQGPDLRARRVVVATGTCAVPVVPEWPGPRTVPLVHSSGYREPSPYAGRDVLVVGAGNSGAEIAAELGRSQARSTTLAVRTPPGLLPRSVGPWPTQLSAFALQHVPDRLGDLAVAGLGLRHVGDVRRGLPVPTRLLSDARRGAVPVLDAGLRDAVRAGLVRVVPALAAFDGDEAVLADGSRVRTDAVVAATGWRSGLEPLVGHLGVLDDRGLPRVAGGAEAAPGLHFVGYGFPLTGYVHAAGHDAAALVDAVTGAGLVERTVTRVRRLLPLPA